MIARREMTSERIYSAAPITVATAVSWRRYFASESRKDLLTAQERGMRAREVLLRTLCVLKG